MTNSTAFLPFSHERSVTHMTYTGICLSVSLCTPNPKSIANPNKNVCVCPRFKREVESAFDYSKQSMREAERVCGLSDSSVGDGDATLLRQRCARPRAVLLMHHPRTTHEHTHTHAKHTQSTRTQTHKHRHTNTRTHGSRASRWRCPIAQFSATFMDNGELIPQSLQMHGAKSDGWLVGCVVD